VIKFLYFEIWELLHVHFEAVLFKSSYKICIFVIFVNLHSGS
jgi:hypothetical protein